MTLVVAGVDVDVVAADGYASTGKRRTDQGWWLRWWCRLGAVDDR